MGIDSFVAPPQGRRGHPLIRAVIFDIGGILEPNYAILAALAAFLGLDEDAMRDQVVRFHRPLTDGSMSLHELYRHLIARSDGRATAEDAVAKHVELYLAATSTPDPRVVSLIESLKPRYTVACLTNTEVEVARANRRRDLFRLFHRAYLSTELGLVKPDAAVYEHVLRDLGCAPAEAVFIDDRLANVEGARAVGLHALHYESFEACRSTLAGFLGHALDAGGASAP